MPSTGLWTDNKETEATVTAKMAWELAAIHEVRSVSGARKGSASCGMLPTAAYSDVISWSWETGEV